MSPVFETLEQRTLLSSAWVFESWEEFLPEGAAFTDAGQIERAWDYGAFWSLEPEMVHTGGGDYGVQNVGWLALGEDLLRPGDATWLLDVEILDVSGDVALARQLSIADDEITANDWMFLNLRTGERDYFLDGVTVDPLFDLDPRPVGFNNIATRPLMMGEDAVVFRRPQSGSGGVSRVWLFADGTLTMLYEGLALDVSASGYVVGQIASGHPSTSVDDIGVAWHADTGLVTYAETSLVSQVNNDGLAGALWRHADADARPVESILLLDLVGGGSEVLAGTDGSGRVSLPDYQRLQVAAVLEDGTILITGARNTAFGSDYSVHIVRTGATQAEALEPRIIGAPDRDNEFAIPFSDGAGNLYGGPGRIVETPLADALRVLTPHAIAHWDGLELITAAVHDELLFYSDLDASPTVRALQTIYADQSFDVAAAAAPLASPDAAVYVTVVANGESMLAVRTASGWYHTTHALMGEGYTRSAFGLTGNDGRAHLGGIAGDGDLVLYYQPRAEVLRLWGANLSTDHLAPQGLETPDYVGPLTGYATPWNGMNIAGLNGDGEVEVVWWAPGLELWRADNISRAAGAPALVGTITATVTDSETIQITGADADGNVHRLWWNPRLGPGNWQTANLTEQIGGPAVDPDSLAGFVTDWDGISIAATDAGSGELVFYWWAPGRDSWTAETVVTAEGAVNGLVGRLAVAEHGETLSVVGVDEGGHLQRFSWSPNPDNLWTQQDLTELAEL